MEFFMGFVSPVTFTDDYLIALSVLLLEAGLGLFLLGRAGLLRGAPAIITAVILSLLAMALRATVLDYETLDYQNFLARWVQFFRDYGHFKALRYSIGNYNIPYLYFMALFSLLPMSDLYLIKLLSTLSDVLLAWSVVLLLSRFTKSRPRLLAAYFTTLFLPTVVLNSAVWGQCDSLYVAPLLLGLWCALEKKPVGAMLLATLAFGFKLQAVFVLPVFAVLLMRGDITWKHLLIFPLAYLLLVLPAVLFGRPLWETITLYFSQTGSIGDGLNYNSPSVFALITDVEKEKQSLAATVAIVIAFVYMLNLLAVAWVNRRKLSDGAVLCLALLFAIGIPFLLPHMHERYFYAADILSLLLAFVFPLFAPVALLTQFASLLGYHAYLKLRYLLLMNYGATALIVAWILSLAFLVFSLREAEQKTPKRRRKA